MEATLSGDLTPGVLALGQQPLCTDGQAKLNEVGIVVPILQKRKLRVDI